MPPGSASGLMEETITALLRKAAAKSQPVDWSARYAYLRPAAVLVPLFREGDQWHVLLTRRTERVNSHKGQVAFPGGAAEVGDESAAATALREAFEEIALLPRDVRVLGHLEQRPTISSFLVTPVVATIPWPYSFQLSPDEVDRVFSIPLDWLADPANREDRVLSTPGGVFRNVIFFQSYDGELLWGASARITLDLLDALQLT